MLKYFTLLAYFSIERTKVLVKVKFLKSNFSYRISKANSFNIKHIPPALAEPLIVFNLDIRKFLLPSFFQHLIFFPSSVSLCLCCIAGGSKLCFASVLKIVPYLYNF